MTFGQLRGGQITFAWSIVSTAELQLTIRQYLPPAALQSAKASLRATASEGSPAFLETARFPLAPHPHLAQAGGLLIIATRSKRLVVIRRRGCISIPSCAVLRIRDRRHSVAASGGRP
jgi:hypothetical protein